MSETIPGHKEGNPLYTKIVNSGKEPINVNITGTGSKSTQWSTEITLQKLLKINTTAVAYIKQLSGLKGINDITKTVDDLEEGLKKLDKGVQQTADMADVGASGLGLFSDATKKSAKEEGRLSEQKKRHAESIRDAISNTENLFSNAQQPFRSISSTMFDYSKKLEDSGIKGAAFFGNLGIATSIIGDMARRISENNDTMRGLIQSGVVLGGGFDTLAHGAQAAGMTTRDFAELLSKNAGLAVSMTATRLLNVSKMFAQTTNLGASMNMTSEESQKSLMSVMTLMQRSGELRGKSDTQVVAATTRYIGQVNELSAATGTSREAIMAATEEMSKVPEIYGIMRMLPTQLRENFRGIQTTMAANFGTQSTTLMTEVSNLMLGGIGSMSENFQTLATVVPGLSADLQRMANATRNGVGAEEASESMVRRVQTMDQRRLRTLALTDRAAYNQVIALQQATQAQYLRIQEEDKLPAEERERVRQRRKDEMQRQAADQETFNKVREAMNAVGTQFGIIAGSLSVGILPTLRLFADVVSGTVSIFEWIRTKIVKIFSFFGEDWANATGTIVATSLAVAVGVGIRMLFRRLLTNIGSMNRTITMRAGIVNVNGQQIGGVSGPNVGGRDPARRAAAQERLNRMRENNPNAMRPTPRTSFGRSMNAIRGSRVGSFVGNAAGSVGRGISGAAGSVGRGISGAAGSVGRGISGAAGSVGRGISGAAGSVGNFLGTKMGGGLLGAAFGALTMANTLSDISERRRRGEINEAQEREGKFGAVGGAAGSTIGGLVGTVLGPIGSIVGSYIGNIAGEWIGKALSAIDFGKLWESFTNGLKAIRDTVTGVFTWIGTKFSELGNFFYNIFWGAIERIRNILPSWLGGTSAGTPQNYTGVASTIRSSATDVPPTPVINTPTTINSPSIAPNTVNTQNTPVIEPTVTNITTATLEYYRHTKTHLESMLKELKEIKLYIDVNTKAGDRGFNQMADAIKNIGHV
jgi:hypothetical protein